MTDGIDGRRAHSVIVRKRSARETHLIVELVEGKNREVRRMLESLGHPVTKLMRVAFGRVELGQLQPGEWRELRRAEVSPFSSSRVDRSSSLDGRENIRRRGR